MWYAKSTGGYTRDSDEGKNNATMIASTLISNGWNLKSVCALLGNGAGESGLNPWRWESDYVPTVSEFTNWSSTEAQSHGYGLFGFTPASKYINQNNASQYANNGYAPNFSDVSGRPSDGEAQTMYFMSTVESSWSHGLHDYYYDDFSSIGVNIDEFYYLSFNEFVSAQDQNGNDISLANLTGAFELCYEKPADWAAASSYSYRVSNAEYWYQYFTDNPPGPLPPIKAKQHRMPIWLMFV